jgi:hypothetical protein
MNDARIVLGLYVPLLYEIEKGTRMSDCHMASRVFVNGSPGQGSEEQRSGLSESENKLHGILSEGEMKKDGVRTGRSNLVRCERFKAFARLKWNQY